VENKHVASRERPVRVALPTFSARHQSRLSARMREAEHGQFGSLGRPRATQPHGWPTGSGGRCGPVLDDHCTGLDRQPPSGHKVLVALLAGLVSRVAAVGGPPFPAGLASYGAEACFWALADTRGGVAVTGASPARLQRLVAGDHAPGAIRSFLGDGGVGGCSCRRDGCSLL